MSRQSNLWFRLIFTGLLVLSAGCVQLSGKPAPVQTLLSTHTPIPTLTVDRLAEPELPRNPTQLEEGRHLYWLNCMTCHGDQGQGLTDEFRSLWVEDHQNCWASGCHTGRVGDVGFPIPHTIPAIISSTGDLPPFATADQLFEYLHTTHPPQHPGYLPEDEYWALTAYLLAENHRLPDGQVLGPKK
ncbi:MAG TPA: c-type cytochrome [Anaerolineales bacterium]